MTSNRNMFDTFFTIVVGDCVWLFYDVCLNQESFIKARMRMFKTLANTYSNQREESQKVERN